MKTIFTMLFALSFTYGFAQNNKGHNEGPYSTNQGTDYNWSWKQHSPMSPPPPPDPVPIDGGLGLLLAAGVGYGLRKMKK